MSCNQDKIEPELEPEPEPEPVVEGLIYKDVACSSCHFTIFPETRSFDGIEMNVQPGDTIGIIEGERERLKITNLNGSEGNPVTIINCDGRAKVGTTVSTNYGLIIETSSYFKVAGTGSSEHTYGIAVEGHNAIAMEYLSTDYEVYGVEVVAAGFAGIVARSNASCDGEVSKDTHTQYNTILHDNYVHDTHGEGFYVGGSHWGSGQEAQPGCQGVLLFEPELFGVRVYNNIVENTGLDGIQVGSAVEDCEIYNNVIRNFALREEPAHQNGIQIGNGTTGRVYNNYILSEGKGFGIFCQGRGDNVVYNNVIVNPGRDGIFAADRMPTPGLGFMFINNTIIDPVRYGINFSSQITVGSVIYNNIVTRAGEDFLIGFDIYVESNNIFTDAPDTLLFADPANLDYSLQAGSPAIDIGIDVTDYDILEDAIGNERPNGDYDVGAFEFHEEE